VLTQIQASSKATRNSPELQIHQSIKNGLIQCTGQPRSVAYLFLSNIQAEFEDREALDASSTIILMYLMNILKDITGKRTMREIPFIHRLRHLYYTSSIAHESETIDEFIFSHIYFIVPTRHFQNFPIKSKFMIEQNATFSEHVLWRFYNDSKHHLLSNISIDSQLALLYAHLNPLNQLLRNGIHIQPKQRMMLMGYGDVEDIDDVAEEDAPHTNSMPFNATTELSMLLAPFSTPVNPGFKQWLVVDVGTPVKPDT
jgi:hypothetical protein